jgi:hypothetical protein
MRTLATRVRAAGAPSVITHVVGLVLGVPANHGAQFRVVAGAAIACAPRGCRALAQVGRRPSRAGGAAVTNCAPGYTVLLAVFARISVPAVVGAQGVRSPNFTAVARGAVARQTLRAWRAGDGGIPAGVANAGGA